MRNMIRSAAVAGVTVLASLAWGAPAAEALAAKCMYPPSRPAVSLGLSTTAPTAGQPVYARGRLTYNKCGVNGTTMMVRLSGRTIGTPKTNATGNYAVRFTPMKNSSVYAAGTFNRRAVSRTLGFAVRTNLRATTAKPVGRCRVTVKGIILPVRKGATVLIQRRITKGTKFIGWQTVATTRTNVKGAYGATVTLPCGAKTGVSTFIAKTKINAANRSATITVLAKR